MFLFDQHSLLTEIAAYLSQELSFLERDELLMHTEIAGEGNMNVVLRLQTQKRSFILKQSRPYVQKYPDLPAPLERIAVEEQFYAQMQNHPFFPKVLRYVQKDHLMLLEDLGQCEDLTSLYSQGSVSEALLNDLLAALAQIHQRPVPGDYPQNKSLRKLNHQHIFVFPYALENGFSLDSIQKGLEELALPFKKDEQLKKKIECLGERYLQEGNTLLHGDYYPGSWMCSDKKLYIIDPEFSFIGFKEFDLGVMAAHLILATTNPDYLNRICDLYPTSLNQDYVRQLCGVEILRRLIGLAQLPLQRSLKEKQQLLSLAKDFIAS